MMKNQTIINDMINPITNHCRRRLLIIVVEGIHFSDDQDQQLIPVLMEFIEAFRDSNDREDQVAVCSAIRSYVGLVRASQFESIAKLLESEHRTPLLETLKMIVRKFVANPPDLPNQHPMLSKRVAQIARAYLNPHVQGQNAAVAMNSVQALAVLASPEFCAVMEEVNACPTWFRQQLKYRLTKLQESFVFQPTIQEAFDCLQTN